MMWIKLFVLISILACIKLFYNSRQKVDLAETPIDATWWNGLTDEWRTILTINQNFKRNGVNVFRLQHDYVNRLNKAREDDYSEMNKGLREFNEANRFSLGYPDLFARALKTKYVPRSEPVDLSTLAALDTLYMVNGPADLTPLQKFPHIQVLIINYCGIDNAAPGSKKVLDLAPLKYLKELRVLHCSSPALESIEPLENLTGLEELHCELSNIKSLAPLKNLRMLKKLNVGSQVEKASVIATLENLEELNITGFRTIPDLSRLKKLTSLCISENELALVNRAYRMNNLDFLTGLLHLTYADLSATSYKGDLSAMDHLQHLKAVSLPAEGRSRVDEFKSTHQTCVIVNSFEFE